MNKTKEIDYSSLDLDVICFVLFLQAGLEAKLEFKYIENGLFFPVSCLSRCAKHEFCRHF